MATRHNQQRPGGKIPGVPEAFWSDPQLLKGVRTPPPDSTSPRHGQDFFYIEEQAPMPPASAYRFSKDHRLGVRRLLPPAADCLVLAKVICRLASLDITKYNICRILVFLLFIGRCRTMTFNYRGDLALDKFECEQISSLGIPTKFFRRKICSLRNLLATKTPKKMLEELDISSRIGYGWRETNKQTLAFTTSTEVVARIV
jgi:hypothetical protein